MKLSVDMFVLRDRYGDEKAIQMLKEAGFDCFDFSFCGLRPDDEAIGANYIEYAKQFKSLMEAYSMRCNQTHAPFPFPYGSKFDCSNEMYVSMIRAMQASAILGADCIIMHPILVPPEEDLFQYNLTFFRSLEPYCEQFGICIAVENLFEINDSTNTYTGIFHTPHMLNQLMAALNSKWFCVCVDVGHAGLTGIKPEDLIAGLNNQTLKALHIHDNDYLFDKHALPYSGKFNWTAIMKTLDQISYAGDLTLEIIWYLNGIPDDFMKEALMYSEKIGRYLIKQR